ncbi:cysteine-rich repeat secretory protein 38-like [Quercus lobata]|uniref:cysteine-rich repeat secretory protein 38-like n=1 Tax=Quercus lobata TaxID=97700 RepID=UPI00124655EF|nr:cysteine-rich repeat secretory protein 38-like [Quercus lobata]
MTCVNEASNEIHRLCPYNKGAIIWYDNCLVKYLNKDFFGEIDNQNKFYMYNLRNVSESTTLNAKTRELLSLLAKEASVTPKLYAVGELELGESKKLYGLTQCTRGIFLTVTASSVLMVQLVNFLVVVMGKEEELTLVGVVT